MVGFLVGIAGPGGALAPLPPERLVKLSEAVSILVRCEIRFENGVASGLIVRCRPKAAGSAAGQVDLSGPGFTVREQEVARALLRGESGAEILHTLGISRETLKTHVRNLCEKTGTRGRTQLVAHLFGGHAG
jgi:DNA-binding CsgD family transcriptional regulator